MEGKQLENLLQGLNVFSVSEDTTVKKKNIIQYLKNSWGLNKKYCFGYFFCEILNFINVVGQMFLLDLFFGGMFMHYGTKILLLPTEDDAGRFDPMIETFPRVTKCEFYKFGPSGTKQILDYLCILPQNLLNEKIFLIMWIWFVILMCATSFQLVLRLLIFQFPILRVKLLEQRGKLGKSYDVETLVRYMHLGDFCLLYNIGKNVDAMCFKDILQGLIDMNANAPPSAPMPNVTPAYNNSFVNDLDGEGTIDLKLRKKILDDTNV
ncbi:UNVERIFIED_CONTAM: hypothetical protein GTU68_002770 [Idotea baltica]|nr:hypothetical protein [Idotea baltica]